MREKCCAVKNQFAAFPAEQGRAQRGKRLVERNFLTTEEKTEKFSFLYCEFYSE